MDIKQILEELNKLTLTEMSMYENPRKDFKEFRKYVLDNPKAKKTYFVWDNALRIPSDTILHEVRRHRLSLEQWQLFLQNYDNILEQNKGNKSRYNGEAYKCLIEINKNTHFGCVIEYFTSNALPILTTAFQDHINSIRSWLYE